MQPVLLQSSATASFMLIGNAGIPFSQCKLSFPNLQRLSLTWLSVQCFLTDEQTHISNVASLLPMSNMVIWLPGTTCFWDWRKLASHQVQPKRVHLPSWTNSYQSLGAGNVYTLPVQHFQHKLQPHVHMVFLGYCFVLRHQLRICDSSSFNWKCFPFSVQLDCSPICYSGTASALQSLFLKITHGWSDVCTCRCWCSTYQMLIVQCQLLVWPVSRHQSSQNNWLCGKLNTCHCMVNCSNAVWLICRHSDEVAELRQAHKLQLATSEVSCAHHDPSFMVFQAYLISVTTSSAACAYTAAAVDEATSCLLDSAWHTCWAQPGMPYFGAFCQCIMSATIIVAIVDSWCDTGQDPGSDRGSWASRKGFAADDRQADRIWERQVIDAYQVQHSSWLHP